MLARYVLSCQNLAVSNLVPLTASDNQQIYLCSHFCGLSCVTPFSGRRVISSKLLRNASLSSCVLPVCGAYTDSIHIICLPTNILLPPHLSTLITSLLYSSFIFTPIPFVYPSPPACSILNPSPSSTALSPFLFVSWTPNTNDVVGGWMVQRDEDGLSVPRLFFSRLLVHSRRGERRQRETHGATACRDPKDHRLPTSLCQGRRAVGMRVERDETNPGRTKVSGCCISPTSTRAVDDDVATDPERRACRNRVRHDRVRICVPEELREHFAEMQPVFKNISLIREDLGPFMRRYAEEHNIMATPRRMLVGSYRGDKILLATPLLRWYLDHGLEVLHVYQVIEYDPIPCFRRFGDPVSTARREGDVHQDKTIIADTMKLLGISGYGKTITNVDRHRDVSYCTEKAASLMINDKRFRQLEIVVDDAYEIEMNKKTVKYTLPVHVGFFVLQYAKMRMLQFYYDFIIRYVERPLFQYCEMDTDSAYLALAGESVDDLVTPALRDHYFRHRSEWLPFECCDEHRNDYVRCRLANRPWVGDEACCKARRAFDKRTPGLFKVEWSRDGFVGLCSKTYYCFGATDKYSIKGLNKRHNTIDKDAFLAVLTNRRSGSGSGCINLTC